MGGQAGAPSVHQLRAAARVVGLDDWQQALGPPQQQLQVQLQRSLIGGPAHSTALLNIDHGPPTPAAGPLAILSLPHGGGTPLR